MIAGDRGITLLHPRASPCLSIPTAPFFGRAVTTFFTSFKTSASARNPIIGGMCPVPICATGVTTPRDWLRVCTVATAFSMKTGCRPFAITKWGRVMRSQLRSMTISMTGRSWRQIRSRRLRRAMLRVRSAIDLGIPLRGMKTGITTRFSVVSILPLPNPPPWTVSGATLATCLLMASTGSPSMKMSPVRNCSGWGIRTYCSVSAIGWAAATMLASGKTSSSILKLTGK